MEEFFSLELSEKAQSGHTVPNTTRHDDDDSTKIFRAPNLDILRFSHRRLMSPNWSLKYEIIFYYSVARFGKSFGQFFRVHLVFGKLFECYCANIVRFCKWPNTDK